jgi:protein SCO1/2
MKASYKSRIWLSATIVLLTLAAIIAVSQFNRAEPPPIINGVLIPAARDLSEFSLLDHQHQPFTREQLLGRWHIIAYGYTYCPDICPMTLTTLAQVARRIEQEQSVADVRFLFYTVDPGRDTPTRLAEYVPWFHPDFVGLTRIDSADSPDLSFETSLGILSVITPLEMDPGLEDLGGYSVSHGVTVFLLNPAAQLQAVFKPLVDSDGTQYFTAEQIYLDYRKIRAYFG